MKKLLLPLLFLPTALSAQQLRIGLGASTNLLPDNLGKIFGDDNHPVVSPAISLSYLHPVLRNAEIGAELAATCWQNRLGLIITSYRIPKVIMSGYPLLQPARCSASA